DLLVEATLGRADVTNPLEQLLEVVGLSWTGRVLQPLVVHREALDQVLGQPRVGPLAELRAAMAADAETDDEDGGERVVLHGTPDLPRPLRSNHQVRLDSCPRVELPLLVDVLQMEVDVLERRLEQLGHEGLREPDRLALEAAVDARAPVLGLVE